MSGNSPAGTDNLVLMGRIGAAHGIKGEVRIQSFCADPLDIAAYGPLSTNRADLTIEISKARLSKNMVIATLKGVSDRNAAEKLNGTELFVARDKLPAENDEDDFYYTDLIGLTVRLADGREVGKVKTIEDHGAGDVIEIAFNNGTTGIFAFTRANFPEIKVASAYLTFDPPHETEVRG
jgi:16S rRNA processing protein RimM